jgi:hypothetical protein
MPSTTMRLKTVTVELEELVGCLLADHYFSLGGALEFSVSINFMEGLVLIGKLCGTGAHMFTEPGYSVEFLKGNEVLLSKKVEGNQASITFSEFQQMITQGADSIAFRKADS